MFALGLLSWMYSRPTEGTMRFLREKFAAKELIAEANITAFKAGWNYGETTEDFAVSYEIKPAACCRLGTYRNITGNLALAYGLVAAARRSGTAAVPGCVPDHPGVGHPARAVQAQAVRRGARSRPRTRSLGSAPRWARRSAARWA